MPPLKPMAQSRRGVTQITEVQVHLLVAATLRFIQLRTPLPPLRPMAQSRCGVERELGMHPDSGYTKIYSNTRAFAALKADGSITAWGGIGDRGSSGGTGAPSDSGYTKIYSTQYAFAALKADGSITAWGDSDNGGTGAPSWVAIPVFIQLMVPLLP
ncbi:hypothetical protein BSPWISOXPB_6561 [uncultured Gammaproteobacteria bacterium]|nr:hypothetical protein BSPWISOXPB_6561 [uncultured Gammaproteobacteria bacterium]